MIDILLAEGSIPACAGEPPQSSEPLPNPWVYPRVCGGTTVGRHHHHIGRGLSPRVRGNQRSPAVVLTEEGSIPACAGEPSLRTCCSVQPRVYPRVCGGTRGSIRAGQFYQGLSPRVRGNRRLVGEDMLGKRSIPACAGEPKSVRRTNILYRVYPRVCGGTGYCPA